MRNIPPRSDFMSFLVGMVQVVITACICVAIIALTVVGVQALVRWAL